jgi:hypothetical protein
MERFRALGECTTASAIVLVLLVVGFGAMMTLSAQALQLATLN